MDRRGFLKGLLASSGAVVAAQFGAPEWMGDEIKAELVKDLSRTSVAVPSQVFDPRPIWQSVSGVRQVWVDHVAKELARQIDRDILASVAMQDQIDRTVSSMVRAVDLDLEVARVDGDKKVIIDTPKVRLTGKENFLTKTPVFELRAGLESQVNILGEEKYRVGYLQEKIIV